MWGGGGVGDRTEGRGGAGRAGRGWEAEGTGPAGLHLPAAARLRSCSASRRARAQGRAGGGCELMSRSPAGFCREGGLT